MANREDLQEKFRKIIVPLMHMSLHDNPTDVALYCFRYFQALLEERQRRNGNGSVQQSKFTQTNEQADRHEPMSQVQESTSEPILRDVHRDKLSLRETSSWNSPSDSKSKPRRFWDLAYDVADAMNSIGDQTDSATAIGDDLYAENSNVKETDRELFGGDEKSRKKDHKNHETNANTSSLKLSENSLMDDYDTSSFDNVTEEELSSIVNLVSHTTDVTSQSTFRKKWSSNADSKIKLKLLSEYEKDNYDEEDVTLNASCPKDDEFETWGSTSHIDSFGSIPQLKKLASFANGKRSPENRPKDKNVETWKNTSPNVSSGSFTQLKKLPSLENVKENRQKAEKVETCCSTSPNESFGSVLQLKKLTNVQKSSLLVPKEIEHSLSAVIQYIQELVKVLEEAKSFINETIQKAKMLSKALPEKPQPAPRKKRSVTTVSSSDNLFQNEERLSRPGNECSSSGAGKGCSKKPQKFLDSKNDYQVESNLSDRHLKGKRIDEEYTKHKTNTPRSKKISSLDQNMKHSDSNNKEVKRIGSKDIYPSNKSCSNEGIVNKGFVMDDGNFHNKSGVPQYHGRNSRHDNGYKPMTLDELHAFSQIRTSRPSLRRIGNLSRHHSQVNRQTPRFRSGFGFPNIGEGGDIFRARKVDKASQYQSTKTNDKADSFDARIKEIRINPFVNGNTGHEASAFENVNDKTDSNVSEKELNTRDSTQSQDKYIKSGKEFLLQNGSDKVDATAVKGEKEEVQGIKIDIKSTKKSSSLNPCAESFNPPSKLFQDLEAMQSLGEKVTIKPAVKNTSSTNIPVDRSVNSFTEIDPYEPWDYEMFDNDFQQEDQEPILYQDGVPKELEILEETDDHHDSRNDVCATSDDMPDAMSYHYRENGVLKGSTQLSKKNSDVKKRVDSKKCQSITKLAEGDQNLEADEEQHGRNRSEDKQEEPGLISACGDFAASEDNHEVEDNSVDNSEDLQVVAAPGSIEFDAGVPVFQPLDEERNALQIRKREEEIEELNFACLSETDSSEVDSSEMSEDEDEFSGESDETKLEKMA